MTENRNKLQSRNPLVDHISRIEDVKDYCFMPNEAHSNIPFFRLAANYCKPGMKILDVGAGKGSFVETIGHDSIYLIDSNPETIEVLREIYENVFLHKLPDTLPFENEFFDVIHCSHIIEHLDPDSVYKSLQEFDRCLKPGGLMIIATPLLYDGFYDDLSHVKPYNPAILLHYLNDPGLDNRTRSMIASEYSIIKIQYRYTLTPMPYFNITYSKRWLQNMLISVTNFLRRLSVGVYKKTAYMVILKKSG